MHLINRNLKFPSRIRVIHHHDCPILPTSSYQQVQQLQQRQHLPVSNPCDSSSLTVQSCPRPRTSRCITTIATTTTSSRLESVRFIIIDCPILPTPPYKQVHFNNYNNYNIFPSRIRVIHHHLLSNLAHVTVPAGALQQLQQQQHLPVSNPCDSSSLTVQSCPSPRISRWNLVVVPT